MGERGEGVGGDAHARAPAVVACVLRSGGDYDPAWVRALRHGLNRAGHGETELVVLTDTAEQVEALALAHTRVVALTLPHGGWFAKFELFRPGVFAGPVLYLDLDTLVLGDLSGLLAYRGPMALLSDFYAPTKAQTGVMAWTPGPDTEAIWERWCSGAREMIRREPSQARVLTEIIPRAAERLQELFPGQIASFKAEGRDGRPAGVRLLCGHGRPRFSWPEAGWAHETWTGFSTEDPLGSVAMILGGAASLWADVTALEDFIGREWPGPIIACNEAGVFWPRKLDHWASYHPQDFPAWEKQRLDRGGPSGYIRWARRELPGLADRVAKGWGGGSSGLLAVYVARSGLGLPRGVLCGVPMDGRAHFHDRNKGQAWQHADAHWRTWEDNGARIMGWLRSMSGRTRRVLGAPTMRWLLTGE